MSTASSPARIKLWVDDTRPAPPGWTHARTVEEAKAILSTQTVTEASFDHDLGGCPECRAHHRVTGNDELATCPHVPTGFDLCTWLVASGRWPEYPPQVHSSNLVGAAQMRGLIARHWHAFGAERWHAASDAPASGVRGDATESIDASLWVDLANGQSRPLILVIDDDRDTRAFLTALLTTSGYRVVTAANGAEGLAEIRVSRPTLILLDIMMPALSGLDFRRQQLADPQAADVPIVCMSALPDGERIAASMGIGDCHLKPIDSDQLLDTIARYCRPTGAPPAA